MSQSEKLLVIGCAGLGTESGRGVNPSEVIVQRLHNTEVPSHGFMMETMVSDCALEEYPEFFANIAATDATKYCGILAVEADNVTMVTGQLVAHNYIDTTGDGRTFGQPRKQVIVPDGPDTLRAQWLSCFEMSDGGSLDTMTDAEWEIALTRDKHTLRANALCYGLLRTSPFLPSAVLRIPYDNGSARLLEQEGALPGPISIAPIESSLETVRLVASEMAFSVRNIREAVAEHERFLHERDAHPGSCANC